MGSEAFMPGIEKRKLQGIDDTAYGVDDASGKEPEKSGRGKGFRNL